MILVTGGIGYIGSHTVVELIQKGFEVVIADNLSNSSIEILYNIEKITGIKPIFEKIDLCDKQKTNELFLKYPNIESVIHFAAYKSVVESVREPLKYYHNNLMSLTNILESMKENHVKNIVFSSSCTVYGQPDNLPVTEETPIQNAWSPYGNTKQMSEQILSFTVDASDINAIALRYFNPTGAHESSLIGELPNGIPDSLVPYITQTAIGKREILSVYGSDYNTPDGSCLRDYLHVTDLAMAHIKSVERLSNENQKSSYEVFNLGTGIPISVLEAVNTFIKVSNVDLNYKITDRRPGDIEKIWADTTYANKELGWKTEKNLDEMLLSAWEWEKALSKNILKK